MALMPLKGNKRGKIVSTWNIGNNSLLFTSYIFVLWSTVISLIVKHKNLSC